MAPLKPLQNDSKLLASMALTDTNFGVLECHLLHSMKEIKRISFYRIIRVLWNKENIFLPLLR